MKARLPQGMGGGPQNINAMMKQAQKMQEQMENLQEDLDQREYDISAGGGAVRAAATSSASPAIVMNDGHIENCFGVVGGAVLLINNYAKNDASFTMNGDVISGCVAGTSLTAVNGWGGAVFLFNKAKADADYTTATINGGEITGCKANEAGVLGMNRGVSSNPYNGGKYYVLGGHIYGNTVGYNGEPGKWYGQSVHVQGLSFNGEALLTIGGNALTVDAGTVLTDEDYPEVPAKEGYTGAWSVVTDPITEDTTIEAVYTINTYTVTLEAEGETVDTIVVDWGTVLTDEDYPEVPAKEGYTGKWIIPADGITGDTTIVPEYTKAAPPVDTGDYAPIALPVALAGIAALVFCMKKREEDAE